MYSGLTSLSTIFQSYHDGVWLRQGAQCSLLYCCLTEVSCPRHLTWYHTQSHYPDTGSTSPNSTPYVWVPSEEQLVQFFTTLVCRSPGLNPWPPVPRSGHSTNWAIGAGDSNGKSVISYITEAVYRVMPWNWNHWFEACWRMTKLIDEWKHVR